MDEPRQRPGPIAPEPTGTADRPRLTPREIGTRIEAGHPAATLLAEDPSLTVQDLRDAVEQYLARRQ